MDLGTGLLTKEVSIEVPISVYLDSPMHEVFCALLMPNVSTRGHDHVSHLLEYYPLHLLLAHGKENWHHL